MKLIKNFENQVEDFFNVTSDSLAKTRPSSSGAGTGGAAAPPAFLPGGARGAVLPFAFQYDSNEANAC